MPSISPPPILTEPEATLSRLPVFDRALRAHVSEGLDVLMLDDAGPMFVTQKGVPDEKGNSSARGALRRRDRVDRFSI